MSDIVETMRRIEQEERKTLEKLSEKNRSKNEMQETIYLGKIKGKDLFRLAEIDNKDNYTAVLYKYFDENAEVKGIKNVRPDGEKQWIYLEEEWEQLRDEIDKNEAQLEEEIEEILAGLGISKEEVGKITETEVDLEQKIREKEEEGKELEEDDEEQEESKDDDKEEQKKKFDQTSKYSNVLNEIDTSKRIDQKGTTLAKALGLDKYGYTKLKIIHADNLNDIRDKDGKRLNAGTKKIAILGVREEEGKQVIEKIPEDVLDYYRGSNNNSVRFDDNDEVEKNTGTYERLVNPKTNKGIAIEMGGMETRAYYQGGTDVDDNTAVMARIEDGHTGWINTETKEIFNSNHGIYHQDKINSEMELHKEDNGDEINRENADGNLDTVSGHIHEIESVDDEIVYNGKIRKVEEVAEDMNIPTYIFINEYNKRAKELHGDDDIDLQEELYDEIEERAEERKKNMPQREEGGRTPGEDEDLRR